MQESREWTPPGGTLGTILEATRRRLPTLDRVAALSGLPVDARKPVLGLTMSYEPGSEPPSLAHALRRETVAVIAEIKRRSPSKGELNGSIEAVSQAEAFERGGAAAISVLTEPEFFGGSLEDLRDVRRSVSIPVLRKDFHVESMQLLETRALRVSAVLLIARALAPSALPQMVRSAGGLQLEAVVEVRDETELQRAIDAGARIIGVNSRNLETLEVDPRVPERLVPMIPPDVVAVWESGVSSRSDVERAASHGADAVLVGSALSKSADPAALVRELAGVERIGRG